MSLSLLAEASDRGWEQPPALFRDVYVWTRALSLAGVNATSSSDFVLLTHWMTALAAAESISMLWLLCYSATESVGASGVVICIYAFSNAFCCTRLAAWHRRYASRLLLVPEALLTVLIVTIGFASALAASRTPTPCLSTAHDLAVTLRPSDLMVGDWAPISLLCSSFWSKTARRFDVPTIATAHGLYTLPLLDDEIARTTVTSGRVYFLGVLDLPEADWEPFLGSKCHLPYHSLDGMRRCARPVAKLACGEVLWQLSTDCYKTK
jgi:hypothetical protein